MNFFQICSKEKEVIEKDAEHLFVFAISNIEAKIPTLSELKKKVKNPKVISIGEFKEEIAMARHFKANKTIFLPFLAKLSSYIYLICIVAL
jgi:hypothetical protein